MNAGINAGAHQLAAISEGTRAGQAAAELRLRRKSQEALQTYREGLLNARENALQAQTQRAAEALEGRRVIAEMQAQTAAERLAETHARNLADIDAKQKLLEKQNELIELRKEQKPEKLRILDEAEAAHESAGQAIGEGNAAETLRLLTREQSLRGLLTPPMTPFQQEEVKHWKDTLGKQAKNSLRTSTETKGGMKLTGTPEDIADYFKKHPEEQESPAGALGAAAAPSPLRSKNEVIRTTKDGRIAVFDAVTRKFLRYADNQ